MMESDNNIGDVGVNESKTTMLSLPTSEPEHAVKEEEEELSHIEVMAKVQAGLADLIKSDPLLKDLPTEITLEEVKSQIALEYGQAMTVNVRRADNEILPVVVVQNAKVIDLKHAIQRHVMLKLSREGVKKTISWRYIWRTFWLSFDGERLTEDQKFIKEYGIKNRNEVEFIKRLHYK